MGGDLANQTIAKNRFQKYSNGEVHIHDDANNLKFVHKDAKVFKAEAEEILTEMQKLSEGAAVIEGTTGSLVLAKHAGTIQAFVGKADEEKEIRKFLKTL